MCSFDLWKKSFRYLCAACVFPMKDLDLTWTLTVNCSSRLFSGSFFGGIWRGSEGWTEVLLKPHHCCAEFCILNEMMNWFAQASAEAGFALRNMGREGETKLFGCTWTKTLNTFAVSRDFICISLCCYRGLMMRNRFSLHPAHLTLRGRG